MLTLMIHLIPFFAANSKLSMSSCLLPWFVAAMSQQYASSTVESDKSSY